MNTRLTSSLLLTGCLVLGAWVTGCANNTAGISAASSGDSRVDSSAVSRQVKIDQLMSRRQGDLLQGSAVLVSQKSTDIRLQYKFTWFDIDGISRDDESNSWQALTLHGKAHKQVQGLAPNPQAVSFEIYVRESHSN
ncbi:protein of unknown function DUF1425 [Shewanella denitrificans OS217]|uniref:DUF1425 domain-containing protein n=1 Tax=Shewanella denitrificans (strain OS217 / ATCC BAA-1090 / DSM 15013) TaxID=318161 RepID=Q12LS4_SHEDO|nr:YcfL family protein [Shewanella denitrificans]ABE55602.1 protein of unknown function DUF1425 [Shewanella denitrificans OS217]